LTEKAKKCIEDLIGEKIDAFRAPFFSIIEKNQWALEILADLGFKYDCSIFPAVRDYGGLRNYKESVPAIIELSEEKEIKEFPINIHSFLGANIVFSGGGFFRIFPYWLIKHWAKQSPYLMTYFHPRDFDPMQPMLANISLQRKIKSYIGLKQSFKKLQLLLRDFEFINIIEADKQTDWNKAKRIKLDI
jgi:hypothetical protein